jgi:hypothetical protein
VWPAGLDGRTTATVEESAAFIAAYQSAVGVGWDDSTQQIAWADGLWVRAFNAKKDAADGGGLQLDLLAADSPNAVIVQDFREPAQDDPERAS